MSTVLIAKQREIQKLFYKYIVFPVFS